MLAPILMKILNLDCSRDASSNVFFANHSNIPHIAIARIISVLQSRSETYLTAEVKQEDYTHYDEKLCSVLYRYYFTISKKKDSCYDYLFRFSPHRLLTSLNSGHIDTGLVLHTYGINYHIYNQSLPEKQKNK